MLEWMTSFTTPDGSTRTIEVRIGDVRRTHAETANPWSAAVEIVGFSEPETTRLRGRDWAEAIEDAARFAAMRVVDKAGAAGGTLDPPMFPRRRSPSSSGAACRIAEDETDEEEASSGALEDT